MILNFCSLILVSIFISSTTANSYFCSNLTSIDNKDIPCFLEPPTRNPARLRSSGNSLVLPCHVARSKQSTIEWWYQDFQKLITFKIYPVFPAVRPSVLRFITSTQPSSKDHNETDIIDVSVLLRNINVDDSGIYRCVIRPWTPSHTNNVEDNLSEGIANLPALTYYIELTGARLCQASLGALPCFSNMRTTSPTFVDAYQTAFLQCVIHNYNRPVTIFWVVGNASVNSVLITDFLTTNQHNGDRLRRIFPLSPYDYSIELTINHDIHERSYSCVIEGATDVETTLFTYIVRSIDLQKPTEKKIKHKKNETIVEHEHEHETEKKIKHKKNETMVEHEHETESEKLPVKTEKIISHDALTPEQIDELKHKNSHGQVKTKDEKMQSNEADEDEDILEFYAREETSTTR